MEVTNAKTKKLNINNLCIFLNNSFYTDRETVTKLHRIFNCFQFLESPGTVVENQ
jgi:hypothetical protein